MAAQLHQARYRNIQIHKSQRLGIGSYGAVYRAKCDTLPCAAKLLHPILFQDHDPGSVKIMQRFEQECQFLSGIRHSNIVQYLGTCRDSDSGLPVLLMELMDESLTHFLEQSQQPLSYHVEVNLCHDIALALAYLHSNDIIHRDLSSNNVLLIAGSRAKVTDFGMSKVLGVNPRATPFTFCPGTEVYMSPEALKNPPVYTDKLDCFSFGVLEIQIMTRQFPNPGPSSQEIEDSRFPIGRIQVPIRDTERRKSHIDLIDPTHPLLSIALHCLSYPEGDRPSAEHLCQQLATLKETPRYTRSMQLVRPGERPAQNATADIERQFRELSEENDRQARQIQQLQQQLANGDTQIQTLQQQLHQQLQEKDETVVAREREIQQLQRAAAQELISRTEESRQCQARVRELEEQVGQMGQNCEDAARELYSRAEKCRLQQARVEELEGQLAQMQLEFTELQEKYDEKVHVKNEALAQQQVVLDEKKTELIACQQEKLALGEQLQTLTVENTKLEHKLQQWQGKIDKDVCSCPVCHTKFPLHMPLQDIRRHVQAHFPSGLPRQQEKLSSEEKVGRLTLGNTKLEHKVQQVQPQIDRLFRQCPICSTKFPLRIHQQDFERHVQAHFQDR